MRFPNDSQAKFCGSLRFEIRAENGRFCLKIVVISDSSYLILFDGARPVNSACNWLSKTTGDQSGKGFYDRFIETFLVRV